MTSTSIYTPITPTYLYIKQHSITKKKYYGKTTRDPYKYNGSGKHWSRHIKKHGKEHIVTLWVSDLYYDTSIVEVALKFSSDNDIVNSDEWVNLIPENGLDGGSEKGRKHTEETKAKMRKPKPQPQVTCPHCGETGGGSNMKRYHFDNCTNQSVRQIGKKHKPHKPRSDKGKPRSEESKAKQSVTMTGKKRGLYKPRSDKGKPQPQFICPHCGKTGSGSNMKRYHFDKCESQLFK